MNKLTLDVVIPCYNDEVTLAQAVSSALQQKEVRHVIIVDDGSTDNSSLIMQKLAHQYTQVRLLSMPKNSGVAQARNWGAMQSDADILAFLDADDEYDYGALSAAYMVFQKYAYISLVRLKLYPINLPTHYQTHPNFAKAWQTLEMTVGGNMVFRRSAFMAAGGFPHHELFRRLGGEDGALGIAFTRCSVVGTLFGEQEPGVKHLCHPKAHALYLLDTALFNQVEQRVSKNDLVKAEEVTAEIVNRLLGLKSILNVETAGIMPFYS
ncbi:glycosyltransferase [Pelistega indica]|uniref:Glycosyltransferase n=1 Tax=Pelistega indica TaxID=1414851 RepID=V8G987_9BURK|nr:glycosyltransferase family 2 protein [Pelistega indica]ETD72498.1 glycosyltransferase [Pelistega indica]